MKKKSPEFKLGAIWVLRKIWALLPIKDDEPSAYMVYYLKQIQKELAQKKMTKHKDPQEDNEEMIREKNRREEEKINRKAVER